MSYSQMLALFPNTDKDYEVIEEFNNSWGTLPVVWSFMYDKYYPVHKKSSHSMWLMDFMKDPNLSSLFKDLNIPVAHRAVFACTFDGAYIWADDYIKFAEDIESFLDDLSSRSIPYTMVNHWPRIARNLRNIVDLNRCPAVGFYFSSCGDNIWKRSHYFDPNTGDIDESRSKKPFDWSKTWSIYDEIGDIRQPCSYKVSV